MLSFISSEKWASLYFKHCYAQFPLELSQTREEMHWKDRLSTVKPDSPLAAWQVWTFLEVLALL